MAAGETRCAAQGAATSRLLCRDRPPVGRRGRGSRLPWGHDAVAGRRRAAGLAAARRGDAQALPRAGLPAAARLRPDALRLPVPGDALGGRGPHAADERPGTQVNASLSRLSHVVSKLERRGWVARRPSPTSRRVTLVSLTDEGWQVLVEAAPGHVETVRSL